jgi:hypothetical protein
MKRWLAGVLVAAGIAVGLSCSDSTASGPGTLNVRLTSPAASSDSAIVFTISGPAALTSATAGTGLRLFQQALGGTSTRFALVGTLSNGATILTIGVKDVSAVSQYSGSISGVAQANFQLRALPGGYALALTR